MNKNLYRPEIDSLRAIAVILVIIFHAFLGVLPGGYLGVDIFFVISGYLITTQIVDRVDRSNFNFSDFYLRRFKRLFPSLILVISFTSLCVYLFFYRDEFRQYSLHLAGVGSFSSNLIYLFEDGYFDASAIQKPLLHLWSLAVEEQFYLFWPFTLIIVHRLKWNRATVTKLLFGVSLLSFVLLGLDHFTYAFYLPLTRIWELLAGAYVAISLSIYPSTYRFRMSSSLRFGAILAIVLVAVLPLKLTEFRFLLNLIAVGAAVVLLIPDEECPILKYLAKQETLKFVGQISYPLYLWHWPLLSLATVLPFAHLEFGVSIILLVLCFLLSMATYYWVENPLRYHPRTKFVGLSLLSILVFLSGIGFMSYKFDLFQSRNSIFEDKNKERIFQLHDFNSYEDETISCDVRQDGSPDAVADIENTFCQKSKPGQIEALFIGDSHAEHFYPGLAELDQSRNWGVIGKAGCPPLKGVMAFWTNDKNDQCYRFNEYIFSTFLKPENIKTVVLGFISPFYVADEGFAFSQRYQLSPENFTIELREPSPFIKTEIEVLEEGLIRSIKILLEYGKDVVLFNDSPEFPFLPESCLGRPHFEFFKQCDYDSKLYEVRRAYFSKTLRRISERFPQVRVFDAAQVFCQKGMCSLGNAQEIYYRDSHHLNRSGSRLVAAKFLQFFFANSESVKN